MVNFSFNKRQDRYYITNNETTDISFTLKKLSNCTEYLSIFGGDIAPSEEREITLTGDGEYQVLLTNDASEESIVTIKHYLELLTFLIQDIEIALCDCGCECHDCSGSDVNMECNQLMMTVTRLMVYKGLIYPQYTAHFQVIFDKVKCLIEDDTYCKLNAEKINGDTSYSKSLLKKMIAFNYLAMYYYELYTVCTVEDKAYVRSKYSSSVILACIKALNICIDNIEDKFKNMASFTINSAEYINQPPSAVGDNTIAVANRAVTVLTLAMFTSGTTPPYSDPEGDPVDALRVDSLPADGVLKLDGILVTIGQVIDVADINANLFTFESPNQDALDSDTFNFSLRDTGSLTFVS